jgi:hypothetical protein
MLDHLEEGTKNLQNAVNYLPTDTPSNPRRLDFQLLGGTVYGT